MSFRNALLILLAVILGDCASFAPASVQQRAEARHERDAQMDASAARIIEVSGTTIPGHPQYSPLGHVDGNCESTPQGNQQEIEGDSVREAAIRKYGNHVDAIINLNSVFVSTGGSDVVSGHWECMGDAVSFAAAAAPATP